MWHIQISRNDNDKRRRQLPSLTGIRLFKDQIEALRWLATHKYRNNRTSADLIRDAVDQFIDREKK